MGRYTNNSNGKSNVKNLIYEQCFANEIEDEEHFMVRCCKYKIEHAQFLTQVYEIFPWLLYISYKAKLSFFMTCNDCEICARLSTYLSYTGKIKRFDITSPGGQNANVLIYR